MATEKFVPDLAVSSSPSSSPIPEIIRENQKGLKNLIEANPESLLPSIVRSNGVTPDNTKLLDLVVAVGNKHAAMALAPIVTANPVALAEIFEAADETDAKALATLVLMFSKQNPEVALWKWFLKERGTSDTGATEIGDDLKTLNDIADVSHGYQSGPARRLTGEDEEFMNHLQEHAPGLARAIKASMKAGPSMSVIDWAQVNAPQKNPVDQQLITHAAVNGALNNKGPKSTDYV